MTGGSLTAEISSHACDYDILGRREKKTFGGGSSWTYGYNDRSEVTSATRKTATGTDVPQFATGYTYDDIGNRLTSTSPVLGSRGYTLNALNQYSTITAGATRPAVGRAPAEWTVQVAGTDATRIGEIYHRTLTGANASAPVWQSVVTRRDSGTPTMTICFWYPKASTSPTYDLDGNLTNDGRWVYTWDAENRLIQMETTTAATTAGHPYTKLKFVYDWHGRRIARTEWQGATSGTATVKSNRRWIYDGWNVIAEFSAVDDVTSTLTRLNTFTWGLDLSGSMQGAGGVGGLLVQTALSGSVMERASYDGSGNIVAWTKSTASAPTSRREYDAFGNPLVREGSSPASFGFSTKMQDVETGLYYYGYRYYDPVAGRWPSRDPIEEQGGVNIYDFVGNSQVNIVDVLGLSACCATKDEIDSKIDEGGPQAVSKIIEDQAARQKIENDKAEGKTFPLKAPFYEWGAKVCCNGKNLYLSDIRTDNMTDQVYVEKTRCKEGDITAGIFHNHPSNTHPSNTHPSNTHPSNTHPSTPDKNIARRGGNLINLGLTINQNMIRQKIRYRLESQWGLLGITGKRRFSIPIVVVPIRTIIHGCQNLE